ncbi:MAG: hypothetical protein ACLQO1_05945 [Steroidobacteraceae bacterium]
MDIGFTVLISNYSEYYRLSPYLRRYSNEMIGVDTGIQDIASRDVLIMIKRKDSMWEKMVPVQVAQVIKRSGLFGDADMPSSQTTSRDMREAQRVER